MKIDLNSEIHSQLRRCRALAQEAEEDQGSPLSQRAAALVAMSNLLKEITRVQLEVINLQRLQVLEATIIELLSETLSNEQLEEFIAEYERRLSIIEQRESDD